MKVVLEVRRRLSAVRRRKRLKLKGKPALMLKTGSVITISEKPEVHHQEHTEAQPPRLEQNDDIKSAVLVDIKECAPFLLLRSDPPLYTECVGEKPSEKQEEPAEPSILVTEVKVTQTARGRPRELLYRSQFNELQESLVRPAEQYVPYRKITRTNPISIDYRAVYHKQAVAEVWYELFNVVKVAVWAILAWLFVCGMIPPLK